MTGGKRKKWEFDVGGIRDMTREEADAELRRFMDAMQARFGDVPDEEIERGAEKVQKFIEGKINWAELFNFTPEMLFQMAEFGFSQFKAGRFESAERVFKVLTVLDWNNAYYHSMMGAILHKQKRYGEAVAEYSQALELDPEDVVSLTNRGEIFLQHGLLDEAEADLKKAVDLDQGDDKFSNRARMLLQKLEIARRARGRGRSRGES